MQMNGGSGDEIDADGYNFDKELWAEKNGACTVHQSYDPMIKYLGIEGIQKQTYSIEKCG